MVTIKAIKDKKIIDLYSALGYDKKISKYKFEALDGATSSFFRGYVNQGNTISRSRVDLEAARLCALNFLHENDRGERFWPANSEGILEYAKDCDREEITDVLTHIFRKKNYSDYVQELKHVRRRKEEEGRQLEKPKCGKKRSKKRKHNEDDSLIATKEGPTLNEKACIASVLELDPPEHPSDVYCGNYIRGLNPQFDLKPAKEFRRKWLSSQSPKWPSSADCRLLRFMFDNGLFIAYDHGDEIPAASLRSFREGTEIEEMSGSEVVTFRNLVTGRVQELTHQLTQKPSLILTYRGDGVIHMTERFERFWGKKEVFWEESAQPPKKRKKSKAIRAKPPLALPNLQVQGDTMSETLPTDDDRDSNLQFASVAETALNLSAGWEALDEGPAEHSFLTKAMVSRGIL
ncbi:hypothetical protein L207DRAFT_55246 [Hyaloscypha variabilis F]|uniref:Uncharacterized protein n=1 Tax=Hyaloscypha variabilis (strain UAMH 11265 / GT02V1 / F) TaxID=1149755 RepID=A0A2J6RL11_HYAVF|nr:hypothetical protein L207DRAFT_55246 [Hyaloscypha variabilis F]